MCLRLNNKKQIRQTRKSYKVYILKSLGKKIRVESIYQASTHTLEKGGFIVSNRVNKQGITPAEESHGVVYNGIHLYTRLRDAYHEIDSGADLVIVQMLCSKADYIANGVFCGRPSAVYSKVKPIKIVAYYKNGKKMSLKEITKIFNGK